MERFLSFRRKVNDPVDAAGTDIGIDIYNYNIIPIKFVRAVRLRVENDVRGSKNLIKSLLIVLELNGSDVDNDTPEELIVLGQLNIVKKEYIEKFFQYFDEIVEQLSGASNPIVLVYKENEDFNPKP